MNQQQAQDEWDAALAKFREDQEGCEWSDDTVSDLGACFLDEHHNKWRHWAKALGMTENDVRAAAADIISEVGIKVEDPFP